MIVHTQAIDPFAHAEPSAPSPAASDIIFIRELKLDTQIGWYEAERQQAQTLEFDLAIGTARNRACITDQLGDTIDYARVVAEIRGLLALRRFQLLEALAEAIAQMVLADFGALWISLSIAKSGIVPEAKFVGVSITRARQSRGDALAPETQICVVPKPLHSNT